MDAMAFLGKKAPALETLYVVFGDEGFLKGQALAAIRRMALGESDDGLATFAGDKAELAEVWNELESLPFFSPKRVVVVEAADPFVTRFRPALEKRIESLPSTGVLVLEVKSWATNTRLAKMVADASSIACKSPPPYKLAQWAGEWAVSRYRKKLPLAAGQLLVDHVGAEMGMLDRELDKLSVYIGDRDTITAQDVDKLVGNHRAESAWKVFDLIGQGDAAGALRFVQRLLEQGEEPFRLVGAFAFQLRKLAQAAHLAVAHGTSPVAALEAAGIAPFGLRSAEQQLKHLTRRRALRLYDQLLELQMGLRGDSPLEERTLLERFVLRLARKLPPGT